MSLMNKVEYAVGREYMIGRQDLLPKISRKIEGQANSNKIVSIEQPAQPHSNKIARLK